VFYSFVFLLLSSLSPILIPLGVNSFFLPGLVVGSHPYSSGSKKLKYPEGQRIFGDLDNCKMASPTKEYTKNEKANHKFVLTLEHRRSRASHLVNGNSQVHRKLLH